MKIVRWPLANDCPTYYLHVGCALAVTGIHAAAFRLMSSGKLAPRLKMSGSQIKASPPIAAEAETFSFNETFKAATAARTK